MANPEISVQINALSRGFKEEVSRLRKSVGGLSSDSTRFSREWRRTWQRARRDLSSAVRRMTIRISLLSAGLVAMTKSALDAGDELIKLSRSAGVGFDAFQRITVALEEAGVSTQQYVKFQNTLTKAIGEADRGLATYRDAFTALNIDYRDLRDLAPEEQFRTIVKALEDTEDRTTRVTAASTLLGSRFNQAFGTVLETGIDNILKTTDSLTTMDEVAAETAETLNDTFSRLSTEIRNNLLNALQPVLLNLNTFLRSNQSQIGNFGNSVANLVNELTPLIVKLKDLLSGVTANQVKWGLLLLVFSPFITATFSIIRGFTQLAIRTKALGGVAEGLASIFGNLTVSAKASDRAFASLGARWKQFATFRLSFLSFSKTIGFLFGGVTKLVTVFLRFNVIAIAITAALAVFKGLADGVLTVLRAFGLNVPDLAKASWTSFFNIVGAGFNFIVALAKTVGNIIGIVFDGVANVVKGVFVGAFAAIVAGLVKIVEFSNETFGTDFDTTYLRNVFSELDKGVDDSINKLKELDDRLLALGENFRMNTSVGSINPNEQTGGTTVTATQSGRTESNLSTDDGTSTTEEVEENLEDQRTLWQQFFDDIDGRQGAFATSFESGLSSAFQNVLTGAENSGQAIRGIFQGIQQAIIGSFADKAAASITNSLFGFRDGGTPRNYTDGAFIAGEGGRPEIITDVSRNTRVIPNYLTEQMMRSEGRNMGNMVINISTPINGDVDSQTLRSLRNNLESVASDIQQEFQNRGLNLS